MPRRVTANDHRDQPFAAQHGAGRSIASFVALAVASLSLACGDGQRSAVDTATGDVGAPAPTDTPSPIALGKRIFEGAEAGGLCFTCHGPDGKGTQLGPNLTDAEWLNTDGTLAGIIQVINTGVATPKQFPSPMPPKGGSTLTDAQVRAVAEYVMSLRAS